MHPAIAFAGAYGPNLATWLLAHTDQLGDAFARLSRQVMAAITDPTASLDRIGSALVSQQNGQTEVIGLLHQHTTQLDGIAVAVNGIGLGQEVLGHSLSTLTSLSMIGLGFSALTLASVAFQFTSLTRRMKTIDVRVQAIQDMLIQEHRARLAHGLDDLRKAEQVAVSDPESARQYTYDARMNLAGSRSSYAEQLSGTLSRTTPTEPGYLWMLARHLTTATLGEATCHLRMRQPDLAVGVLEAGARMLRTHASAVFNRIVAYNPTRFLMPALREHGLTLEVLAELYRQAAQAGVLGEGHGLSAPDLFESLRDRLATATDPLFWKTSTVQRLRAEFAEVSAAVEEVNRVKGLALAIGTYQTADRSYADLAAEILKQIDTSGLAEGCCMAFFPTGPAR